MIAKLLLGVLASLVLEAFLQLARRLWVRDRRPLAMITRADLWRRGYRYDREEPRP
jgi:hypothetical protein